MKLDRLDHLVLTVNAIEATCRFYESVLGMKVTTFGNGRRALVFGRQKINLHEAGREFAPHAREPKPGSADLCFITETPLAEVSRTFTPAAWRWRKARSNAPARPGRSSRSISATRMET